MRNKKWIVLAWISVILVLVVAASYVSHTTELYLPVVYNEYTKPSVTPKPTATPRPGIWTFVGRAKNYSGRTEIHGEKPSGCYEVTGSKSGKKITVLSRYVGDVKCQEKIDYWNEHGNIPRVIPFPLSVCTGDDNIDVGLFPCFCPSWQQGMSGFFCGEVYRYNFPSNSQVVCSGDIPDQCVDSRNK